MLNTDVLFFVTVFIAIFSVLNPIGAVPTLVALTENFKKEEKARIILKSISVAAGMLYGFMLLGIYIFQVLGIDISDFKVAGGILLFKVAFDMLQGRTSNTKLTQQETEESMEKEAIGIVPIGTPLLAGPGSITTAIIYFNSKTVDSFQKILVILAVLLVLLLSYLILRFSTPLFDRLGKTGSLIISRIMGLLLASIAVEFVVTGLISIVTTYSL
ncbi:MAG TPA: MarC family protein [Thermoplasmataceae archaeon]|nr:MarC family protein [Thermoplasmatales archaeon AK]HLH86568.1 MarC family protein [Thermoplasmataceae archaeon]